MDTASTQLGVRGMVPVRGWKIGRSRSIRQRVALLMMTVFFFDRDAQTKLPTIGDQVFQLHIATRNNIPSMHSKTD
jgi:hypothetical protein